MSIVAWLKIYKKPHEDINSILHNLDLWIALFSDKNKYSIIIYNENIDLPEKYNQYTIVNRKHLIDTNEDCRKLQERITNNTILDEKWKGAATALSFPYWYCSEKYIWNIDASDIQTEGNYLDKAFDLLVSKNLPQLSLDLYMLPNKQWSFGVNISFRLKMKQIIDTVLDVPIRRNGWGTNLDGMITSYLYLNARNICCFGFTTPGWIMHEGPVNIGLCSRFNKEKNMMETNFYGKRTQYGPLHPKIILL